jgi:hypothetical protein
VRKTFHLIFAALLLIGVVNIPARPARACPATLEELQRGRAEQTSDASGTFTFTYDDLNRLKTAVPGIGQGATYTYTPDLTNKRWTTTVALGGVTGNWQFGEDSKGRIAEILNPFGQYTSRQFDPEKFGKRWTGSVVFYD